MLEKFAFGPRNKPHPSSPTALAHDAQPRQAGGVTYTGEWKDGGRNGGLAHGKVDGLSVVCNKFYRHTKAEARVAKACEV